jgi:hypothetical protein
VVFNTPFYYSLVLSRRSVLLVEETEVQGENHRPVVSNTLRLSGIRTHNFSRDRHLLRR